MIIWLMGMSGSGKTTLSELLKYGLIKGGYTVKILDGDVLREKYNLETDFTREGILKNNHIMIKECEKIINDYDYILVSLITPFECIRREAREKFKYNLFLVYLKCDRSVLIERDVKGLYKKALNGEIKNLIGFSKKSPFEEPQLPDLVIDTGIEKIGESLTKILGKIYMKNE
ncbi:MAG: adenylyl-sulfate kinase [Promethearchaeota archaeon]